MIDTIRNSNSRSAPAGTSPADARPVVSPGVRAICALVMMGIPFAIVGFAGGIVGGWTGVAVAWIGLGLVACVLTPFIVESGRRAGIVK